MTDLRKSDIKAIEEAMAFPRGFGYVLDFSDRTMEEFFQDEFGIDIFAPENKANGSSKRKCLTTFIGRNDAATVLRVLLALWERREGLLENAAGSPEMVEAHTKTASFRKVIEQLRTSDVPSKIEGIESFVHDRTLDELVADIRRTLEAEKPEVAIDRLHTYCVKKVTHLLQTRGVSCEQEEPLHSRFGKYRKELEKDHRLHEFTDRALRSFISLFESFNDLRNNRSLAHDNQLLEPIEARFIVSSISAILVMLRALETRRYGE